MSWLTTYSKYPHVVILMDCCQLPGNHCCKYVYITPLNIVSICFRIDGDDDEFINPYIEYERKIVEYATERKSP